MTGSAHSLTSRVTDDGPVPWQRPVTRYPRRLGAPGRFLLAGALNTATSYALYVVLNRTGFRGDSDDCGFHGNPASDPRGFRPPVVEVAPAVT